MVLNRDRLGSKKEIIEYLFNEAIKPDWPVEDVHFLRQRIAEECEIAVGDCDDEPHFLIMSRYGDYHIGCCTLSGIPDVLAEEPGVTFKQVPADECPNCREEDEPMDTGSGEA